MWKLPFRPALRSDADRRAIPDFLILGAQKSGTTSLFAWLAQHPQVVAAKTKEVHFFNRHLDEGEDWYRNHFPRRRTLEKKGAITGEATPAYLFHPACPDRAHALVPDARLLVILRDPARRAYSQFQHMQRVGQITSDFRATIEEERPWLHRPFDEVPFRPNLLRRGLYADQISRWCGPYPREQMLVLIAEQVFRDPALHLARVFDFLGLSPLEASTIVATEGAKNRREYAELDPDTLAELGEIYREPNQRLAELLGEDLSWVPGRHTDRADDR